MDGEDSGSLAYKQAVALLKHREHFGNCKSQRRFALAQVIQDLRWEGGASIIDMANSVDEYETGYRRGMWSRRAVQSCLVVCGEELCFVSHPFAESSPIAYKSPQRGPSGLGGLQVMRVPPSLPLQFKDIEISK